MRKQKLLITGASGFVGQNILNHIRNNFGNFDIYNCGRTAVLENGITNIKCNVEDFDFTSMDNDFDFIVHLLALSNNAYCTDFSYAQAVNIEFTKKILDFACSQKKLKKIIHLSSIITYNNSEKPPVQETARQYLNYNTYSFTKGIAEHYANYYYENLKLPTIIFRLSNIYGPYQKIPNSPFLIPSKITQALNEGKIEVANVLPKRDWIYSEDAAEAIVKSLHADFTGILNLGSGSRASILEIMNILSDELNVPFFNRNLPTSGPLDFYCDISEIKKVLGWQPKTELREGLKKTIDYIKKQQHKTHKPLDVFGG